MNSYTRRLNRLAAQEGVGIDTYLNAGEGTIAEKLGISKDINPFSKLNMPYTTGSAISAGADLVSPFITKGRQVTGFGGAALGLASKAGDALLMSRNPYAMAAGAVLKGVNIVGNAAFGNNAEHLAQYNNTINNLYSTKIDSTSNDNIIASSAAIPSAQRIRRRSFGLANGSQRNLYVNRMNNAEQFAYKSVVNASNDYNHDVMKNFKVTQAYNGGPLEMIQPDSAIGYDAMQTYLRNGYLNATKNNKVTSLPNNFSNQLAFGGNVLTGGNTYNLGLTHINPKALTHEENPYGGVDMGYDSEGNLNQVEGEEIVLNGPTEDTKNYVMSNRLTVPIGPHSPKLSKKERAEGEPTYEEKILRPYEGMTFAEATKKLERKIYGDKGDNMRRDSMQDQNFWHDMQILVDAQEQLRQQQQQQEMMQQLAQMSPEELMMLQQQMQQPYQQEIAPNMYDYSNSMQPNISSEQYVPNFQDQYNISPIQDAMTQMSAYGGRMFAEGGKIDKNEIQSQMDQLLQYAQQANNQELLSQIQQAKNLNLRKQKQFIEEVNAQMQNQQTSDINQFGDGGKIKENIMKILNLQSEEDLNRWLDENHINKDIDWDNAINNTDLIKAVATDNIALADAINRGYDFGAYVPDLTSVSFDDDRGNWDAQTVQGWWGSNDPAWKQVIEAHPELTQDTNLTREQLADYLRNTEAFKHGTKWLQDSEDNRLTYLQRIINNPKAPKRAKQYALRFADANGWKQNAARDYETIFNNPSGRAANPGTYWKTPIEVMRGNQVTNFMINDDGTIEEIKGDVPTTLSAMASYNYATPDNDIAYNYYRRPIVEQPVEGIPDYKVRQGNTPIEQPVVQQPVEQPKPEEDPGKKGGSKLPPYPLPSNVPILAGIGLNGLMLANNLFSPLDTSESDYLLNASRNSGYMPISTDPKQVYVHPHVQDLERAQIAGDNLLMGAARGISNNAGLNRGVANAGLIGLYNNGITQQGVNQLQALNNNAQNERQDAQVIYGQESDNAARALSVAQANQQAYAQAISRNLDLKARAMGLRQQARQNRERAINSNLSGILNSINNYYMQKYPAEQLGWYLQTGGLPGVTLATSGFGSGRVQNESSGKSIGKCGGKLRKSRKNFKI